MQDKEIAMREFEFPLDPSETLTIRRVLTPKEALAFSP